MTGLVKSALLVQSLMVLLEPAFSTLDTIHPAVDISALNGTPHVVAMSAPDDIHIPVNVTHPGQGDVFENLIEQKLHDFLSRYDGLFIPELPTFDIEYQDIASIALSLNSLTLTGVSDVSVTFVHQGLPGNQTLQIVLPQINLAVGTYISGGHINNLPFNGKGPMSLTLYKLSVTIKYEWEKYAILYLHSCVKDNSTNYDLDLRRMQAHFGNLNAGTDQGQLIDIMISSFGPDIIDYLEDLLNTSLYDILDDAFVALVNSILGCQNAEELPLEMVVSDAAQLVEDLLRTFLEIKVDN